MKEIWDRLKPAIGDLCGLVAVILLGAILMGMANRIDNLETRLANVEQSQREITGSMVNVVDVMKRIANVVAK